MADSLTVVRLIGRLLLFALCAITLSCARSSFVDDKEVVITRMVDVALKLDFDDSAPQNVISKSGWLGSNVTSIGSTGATKASVLERAVNDLNVFFVRERHESTDDAGLVRHIFLDSLDLKNNDSVVLKDVYLGKYIMYMVANVGDLSQGGKFAYTARMVKDFTFTMPSGLSNANDAWAILGLPMYSREVVDIRFEGDGVKPISGRLHFGVAKVNFKCVIDTTSSNITNKILYISSVALINTGKSYSPFNNKATPVETKKLYMTSYNDIDTKKTIDEWHYVFPNMAGDNLAVTKAEDRTSANAPANSTYIYLRATYINGSTGNKEVYGFFVYLGDQDIFSNFDTRAGNEYNLTVNIQGIDPDTDHRISFLRVSGGLWNSSSVKLNDLTTMTITVKAQNLNGQSIMLRAQANPAPYIDDEPGMCKLDLRHVATPDIVEVEATYESSLQMRPLVVVDSDNFEQSYILGFTPLINVGANYPLKVSVSTATGAVTDMDTPTINIVN